MLIRPNKKFNINCDHCSWNTFILTSYRLPYFWFWLMFNICRVLYLALKKIWMVRTSTGQIPNTHAALLPPSLPPLPPHHHHQMKRKNPQENSFFPPIERDSPLALNTIWITLSSSYQTPNIWHNKGCLCSLSHPLILNILIDRSSY